MYYQVLNSYQNKYRIDGLCNYNRGELTDFSNLSNQFNQSNVSNRSAKVADLNYGPPLTFPPPGFYPPTSSPIRHFGLYGTGGGLPFGGGDGFGRPPLMPAVAYAPPVGGLGGMYGFSAPGLGGVGGGLYGFGSALLSGPQLLPPVINVPPVGGLEAFYAFGGPGLLGLGSGLFGPGGPPDPLGLYFEILFIQSLIDSLTPIVIRSIEFP